MVRYSICATHYNSGEHLVNSVADLAELIDGHSDWELVISDAGSTDGSLDYLQGLAEEQQNIHVIVEQGANIGRGRQIAADAANGEILFQLGDLDGDIYADRRFFEIAEFYEMLLKEEGEVELSISGAMISTKSLLDSVGGWRPIPVAEERELDRRYLRCGKLRYCDVKVIRKNMGEDKTMPERIKRITQVYSMAMVCGVQPLHYLQAATRNEPLHRKVIKSILWTGAVLAYLLSEERYQSYDPHDQYAMDLGRLARENHPEIVIDTPPELKQYEQSEGPVLNQ